MGHAPGGSTWCSWGIDPRMPELLRGYAVVSFCGWAVLPTVRRLLGSLPDQGYAACRCFGWVLAAWLAWMLAWATGRPLTTPLALGSIVLIAAVNWTPVLLRRRREGRQGPAMARPARFLWGRPGLIACSEILFLLGLLLFAFLEKRNPAVDPDSERFMDYAFLRACLRTPGLPVADPWFAGQAASYYHFGYAMVAFLVRACGTDPARFFTTAVALPFALLWYGAFGIGSALTGRARGGVLAAVLTLGAGNLEWLRHGLRSLPAARFDWFAPSRVIEGTITEFPWFSLLWGDLHPYVLAMPMVACALAFILDGALKTPHPGATAPRRMEDRWISAGRVGALALLGGAVLAVHPWDYPLLFGTAVVITASVGGPGRAARSGEIVLAGLLAWPLFLPFLQGLAFGGRGLGRVAVRSDPLEWLMAYGPFALLFVLAAPLVLASLRSDVLETRPIPAAFRVSLALGGCAWLTALACEMVYVRDLFETTPLARMNTVFKLHRFAWLLLALASSVWMEWLMSPVRVGNDGGHPWWSARDGRLRFRAGWLIVTTVLATALAYPLCGTAAWLRARATDAGRQENGASRQALLPGANAETLFRALLPGDAAAASFLARSAGAHDALLEETGDPYTWSSRISTFSGVPTVLGWGNHEAVWRGRWDEIQERSADVAAIYARPGTREACDRLRAYGVKWIVAGERVRQRYGAPVEDLGRLAHPAFARAGTEVYRVADVCAAAPR